MELQVGQAVRYDSGNPRYMHYGVIVDVDEKRYKSSECGYEKNIQSPMGRSVTEAKGNTQ